MTIWAAADWLAATVDVSLATDVLVVTLLQTTVVDWANFESVKFWVAYFKSGVSNKTL